MKELTYDQLEKLPEEFIQFYIKVKAQIPIPTDELKRMIEKYPDYFTKHD